MCLDSFVAPLYCVSVLIFFTFRLSSPQEILKSADFVRPGIFYFNIIFIVRIQILDTFKHQTFCGSGFKLYDHLKTGQNVQFSNGRNKMVATLYLPFEHGIKIVGF